MALLKWLDGNLERLLAGLLLVAIVVLISVNVFMRYIMNASLSWGEELTLWLFVWFVWLSVSYAFREGAHVRITFLRDLMGPRGQLIVEVLVDLLILVFLGILVVECLKLMSLPFVSSQKSVVMGIPIPVLYASAPVGAAFSSIRVVQHLVKTLRTAPAAAEA